MLLITKMTLYLISLFMAAVSEATTLEGGNLAATAARAARGNSRVLR
jgi:hypothetical protein